jgi:hypothetical protein
MLRRLQWPTTCRRATVRNGRSSQIAAPRTATAGPAATGRRVPNASGSTRPAAVGGRHSRSDIRTSAPLQSTDVMQFELVQVELEIAGLLVVGDFAQVRRDVEDRTIRLLDPV